MKKNLLFLFILCNSSLFAQVLQSDNFNSLTVGNVGTDVTGVTVGQGNWLTLTGNGAAASTSTNAANSNFRIVTNGNSSSNGLLLEGPDGDLGSRFMWRDGLPAAWTARTPGNNIIQVEVDVNPGTRGTSVNTFGIRIYNADFSRTLSGFQINSATGELSLVAYSTPAGNPVDNYSYSLAAAPGVQLPENTWSRVGISYNRTTGRANINSNVITGGVLGVNGSSPTTNPAEVDFVVLPGGTVALPNTSSATMIFDNLVVRAASSDATLSTDLIETSASSFSIYPNPVNNVLNILAQNFNNSVPIDKIVIYDVNGRVVKALNGSNNNQIDVSDLTSGLYLLNIETTDGISTQKFVKN